MESGVVVSVALAAIVACVVGLLVVFVARRAREGFSASSADPAQQVADALLGKSDPDAAQDVARGVSFARIPDLFGPSRKGSSSDASRGLSPPGSSRLEDGMRLYASVYTEASLPAPRGSKVWRNLVNGAAAPASCEQPSLDLVFANAPTLDRKQGFTLGRNSIVGPRSMDIGIAGDSSYAFVALLTFVGDLPDDGSPVSVFGTYANTPDMNGFSLELSRPAVSGISSGVEGGGAVIPFTGVLSVGGVQLTFRGDQYAATPEHVCLLVVSRGHARVAAYLVDLEASSYSPATLLDVPVPALGSVTFSNVEMTVNGTANFPGRIATFGVLARDVPLAEVVAWYNQFRAVLEQFDPAYQAYQRVLEDANAAKRCPFDAATCAACGGVRDWTSTASIVASGQGCLNAYARYCTDNPGARKCECWDVASPAHATPTCAAMRATFSGTPLCPAPPPADADRIEKDCAKKEDDADIIRDIVRPENIVATGQALALLRGPVCAACRGQGGAKCKKCRFRPAPTSTAASTPPPPGGAAAELKGPPEAAVGQQLVDWLRSLVGG
jgi:hypothetical protein